MQGFTFREYFTQRFQRIISVSHKTVADTVLAGRNSYLVVQFSTFSHEVVNNSIAVLLNCHGDEMVRASPCKLG
ncbi:hypothetical protein EXS56_02265, partial [Candidatus Kaiserbacteria bacterium]|nr:hypothetical protein [Candidatus Kaiserbacteria bacterium]